ncbi:MAG: penicillin acylase family protein [Nocardioidaceae bacterium]
MRRNFLLYAAVALAIVLVAASVFAVVTVRRPFPQIDGSLRVPGLSQPVRVTRDSYGVPQIYADNSDDLFFAQGYVQAQDRFFEMDFRRHVTSGTLSELFGRPALATDEVVRTLGWRRVAEREIGILDPATRRYLQDYSDGVNAYISGKSGGQLSLEYSVLSLTGPDYVPSAWTPADSVAWLKAMAWDLRGNMSDEIDRLLASTRLDTREVEQLYPDYPYAEHSPIVTSGAVQKGTFVQDPGRLKRPAPHLGVGTGSSQLARVRTVLAGLPTLLGTGDGIGSNSWAVSGEMTASGKPLLANDPHLAPSMPAIWYQMGLHCTTVDTACPFDVSGFTFAGLPGVVIGHNDRIAWGLTTMDADVTDLYLERVDDASQTYQYGARQLPLRTRTEQFTVAGEDKPVTITVRSTRDGPILSDVDSTAAYVGRSAAASLLPGVAGRSYAVALRWTALTPGRTMDAVFGIDAAGTWNEFRSAAALMDVPSQNLVYADVAGHIGYQAPGRIPIRPAGDDGRWPVPGWQPGHDWKGYIPFDALPSVLDPPSGYVVTANQAVIGPSYPYLLTSDSAYGYRSQRIIDLLRGRSGLTVDDMTAIQTDTYNANAATLTPYLQQISLPTPYYRQGQRLFQHWDYSQPADSAAAAYFNVTWRDLLALTFHDELPEAAWPDGGERWFEVVKGLLKHPNSHWWDDVTTEHVRETRDDILKAALLAARDDMTRLQSRDVSKWTWGHLHELRLVNPTLGTSGVGAVEWMFNRGPYEVGGGGGTVDATSWDARDGFGVTSLPSMRMVVDLSDFDASRWIQVGGESGHAFAGSYVDQTPLWVAGDTLPWAYSADAVDAATKHVLTLEPEPTS